MQGHSIIISEPVAHTAGFVGGLAVYGLFHCVGVPPSVSSAAAVGSSALINLVLGAKINLALLDVLSLVLVRPASAAIGGELVHLMVSAISSHA